MSDQRLLSRVAESLYWIGRYVERADGTARIINAYIHRIAEDPFGDAEQACRALFAILGVTLEDDEPATTDVVLDGLVFSRDSPSAIAGSLRAAYENARRSREVISSEMWVCINRTHDELPVRQIDAQKVGAASYFRFVSDRAAQFTGLSDATISHDEGWHFLVLGRSIERIDMTCRLLDAQLVGLHNSPDWLTLLRAAGAMESYLRESHGSASAESLASFLLLDRLFPRSVFHSLNVADNSLEELTYSHSRVGDTSNARRTIGRARNRLEYSDSHTLVAELPELLDFLEQTCASANDEITTRYFRQVIAEPWATERGV
jgi:uncharacterized alpha-E superfamily protein